MATSRRKKSRSKPAGSRARGKAAAKRRAAPAAKASASKKKKAPTRAKSSASPRARTVQAKSGRGRASVRRRTPRSGVAQGPRERQAWAASAADQELADEGVTPAGVPSAGE